MLWLFLALCAGLLVAHMARPRFEKRRLSSARFFKKLPAPDKSEPRWKLALPKNSKPFRLQIAAFILIGLALFPPDLESPVGFTDGLKVWLLVDTSASMLTQQQGATRLDAARTALHAALDDIEDHAAVELKLSLFDMELRNLHSATDPGVVRRALAGIEARPLGTDLAVLHNVLGSPTPQFEPTHVWVVSDRPAPDWVADLPVRVIWKDIGLPVENVGFTGIETKRNGLTGNVELLVFNVAAYAGLPAGVRLQVMGPDGVVVYNQTVDWLSNGVWRGEVKPEQAGSYTAELVWNDAYDLDNTVEVEVPDSSVLTVDWRLADRSFPRQMGWRMDAQQPDFRVMSVTDTVVDEVPALLVGSGYGGDGVVIRDFVEGAELLQDLNLDALERAAPVGDSLPTGFLPVVRGTDGRAWVGRRSDPVGVLIPGPPLGLDGAVGDVSRTLFFNGLRRLIGPKSSSPIYSLTSPGLPDPQGNRLALHQDEGDTSGAPASFGGLNDLDKTRVRAGERQWPPLLMTLAVFLLVWERVRAVFGDDTHR